MLPSILRAEWAPQWGDRLIHWNEAKRWKFLNFIPRGKRYKLKELLGERSAWIPNFTIIQQILCARHTAKHWGEKGEKEGGWPGFMSYFYNEKPTLAILYRIYCRRTLARLTKPVRGYPKSPFWKRWFGLGWLAMAVVRSGQTWGIFRNSWKHLPKDSTSMGEQKKNQEIMPVILG